VARALAPIHRLGLDTGPLIYFAEAHPTFGPTCAALFSLLASGSGPTFVVSTLCYTETLVAPLRADDRRLVTGYRRLLARTPGIETRPVTRAVAERAADLRARYSLRTPDALHVATAMVAGCDAFLTNDLGLLRVGPDIRVLFVRDLRP
jgi:predicted nucleic acid-binding protein